MESQAVAGVATALGMDPGLLLVRFTQAALAEWWGRFMVSLVVMAVAVAGITQLVRIYGQAMERVHNPPLPGETDALRSTTWGVWFLGAVAFLAMCGLVWCMVHLDQVMAPEAHAVREIVGFTCR